MNDFEKHLQPLMEIDILSLFPSYFTGPFDASIIKKAIQKNIIDIRLVDIRKFSKEKHQKVDDRPFGGGPGMVLMAQPICDALRSVKKKDSYVIYLSPQGEKLDAKKAKELSSYQHLVLLCGHYEGVDERVKKEIDEEISIGDYVLTNGCIAAIVLVDATIRFLPNVLGDEKSMQEDSYCQGIFDFPTFTRPRVFEGEEVPEVLLQGNHAEIEKYRKEEAWKKTKQKRPDLIEALSKKKEILQ